MRVVLSTSGSRGEVEPVVRRAAPFDVVVAAAEGCDAPVATGMMPTGACR